MARRRGKPRPTLLACCHKIFPRLAAASRRRTPGVGGAAVQEGHMGFASLTAGMLGFASLPQPMVLPSFSGIRRAGFIPPFRRVGWRGGGVNPALPCLLPRVQGFCRSSGRHRSPAYCIVTPSGSISFIRPYPDAYHISDPAVLK